MNIFPRAGVLWSILFFASFIPFGASAQSSNLLGNPSLETASGSVPSGWSSSVWGTTKATFTYPSGGAHTGTRFVKTQVTTAGSGDAKWFPASVAVSAGATYTFSDWYLSTAATEVDLEYTLSTGGKKYAVLGSPAASGSWKQFQASFTVPANAISLKIYHLIEAVGALSVDDFSLTTTATSGTAPVLTQVTPVASSTTDTTPDYVFSSTKAGTIAYGGDCKSTKTAAAVGNNTITFSALAQGSHSNCTISVRDAGGLTSNILAVPAFTIDTTRPAVTLNQAASQADPATTSPILFTVVFSEPVADFASSDVSVTGTAAGAKTVAISGSGTTYTVAVSGMTGNGTVMAAIAANTAHDAAGNGNTASASADKTVTYNTTPAVQKPVINSFTATPSAIVSGQSSTLSWSVDGATFLSIDQGVGAVSGTSVSVAPAATTTYTLSAANSAGTSTASVTVNVSVPQQTTQDPNNLVQNGDFETADGTAPANWRGSSWGTNSTNFVYPAAGKNGNGAQIQIVSYTSGDAKWLFPKVNIAPNTVYLYSEDFSATVPTEIDVEYTMSDGSVSYKWLSAPAATSGWSNTSFSITPPAGAVSMQVFHAIAMVGSLSLDNVSLKGAVLQQTNNLVQNGDFEIPNGSSPLGWTASYWGTNTPVFTYPVAGNGGGKAAQVQFTGYKNGDAKWVSGSVSASSHTIYAYKEDYKSNVTTNITVEYKKTDGTYLYEWLGDLPPASNWTTYSVNITVPAGVVSFKLLHALVSVGTLAIDNVDLEAQSNDAFASGMATLIFDDGLSSQYKNALPILSAAGYKAGFYIITTEPASGDTDYMTWAQIKALAAAGQEIGSHTRTHPYLTQLTAPQLQSEVAGAKSDLSSQGLPTSMFVYPYGDIDASVESAVAAAGYTGARGSKFGLNNKFADPLDLYDIRLDAHSTLPEIEGYIDQAVADKRWIIFEIHDVVASGGDSYAITPGFLQTVVNYLTQKNAQVVTLSQGVSQLSQ